MNWRCYGVLVFNVLILFVNVHARGRGVHW